MDVAKMTKFVESIKLQLKKGVCVFLLLTPLNIYADEDFRQELLNLNFISKWTLSGKAPLVNGEYHELSTPESATETIVKLSGYSAAGVIKKQPILVAITISEPGGSGTFYDLALLSKNQSKWVNVDILPLGDRIKINSLRIDEGFIFIDLVEQGPNDQMCCPTHRTLVAYSVLDNRLVDADAAFEGPKNTMITGVKWQWQHTLHQNGTKTTPKQPSSYIIKFKNDGKLSVQADCNVVNGLFKLKDSELSLKVSPDTMSICKTKSLGKEFLNDLSSSALLFFDGNDLYIDLNEGIGTMKFSK